jgi:hypothetical protein
MTAGIIRKTRMTLKSCSSHLLNDLCSEFEKEIRLSKCNQISLIVFDCRHESRLFLIRIEQMCIRRNQLEKYNKTK